MYNRALTNKALGYVADATEDLALARQAKMDKNHAVVDDVLPTWVRAWCARTRASTAGP
jgi:hypothetical protein